MKCVFQDNKLVCQFTGKLDTQASMQIEPEIDALCKEQRPSEIRFDLDGVEYVASAFLRICSRMSKMVNQEQFSIVNTQPNIKKIFKIAGLEKILNVS